jgi:hypothetical protein
MLKLNLGKLSTYQHKRFFIFKRESFMRHQSYTLNKRVKSEFLKMSAEEFDKLYEKGQFWKSDDEHLPAGEEHLLADDIESRKQKVVSKEESVRGGDRPRATWDAASKTLNVPPQLMEVLCSEFGRGLVETQIPKMERWLKVNKPKRGYNRFMWNWLNKETPDHRGAISGGRELRSTITKEDLDESARVARSIDQAKRNRTESR